MNEEGKKLIDFWSESLLLSEENKKELENNVQDNLISLAPSEKLYLAAKSLSNCKRVLDYGCGNAWASIIAIKNGCNNVIAVDAAKGALETAKFYSSLYKLGNKINFELVTDDWFQNVPNDYYDGIFCSNVLDVVPDEVSKSVVKGFANTAKKDANIIIGLNFYLSVDMAEKRGLELIDGNKLYINDVLRLVSRSDEEWKSIFSQYFDIIKLEHFAWPGEKNETRRLFYLKKR